METNEAVKRALWRETEAELVKLVERIEDVGEGDLKELEQQVLETIFAIGRGLMESILNRGEQEERAATRREGSCGHQQRLVGERPKELLTLLGKVKFRRPYYQCLLGESSPAQPQGEGEPEEASCSHGEAPADALWGVQERRTTAGVQAAVSYLCATLTLEEAAETFTRLLPLGMSARQALSLMQPVGEALAIQEEEAASALWQEAAQAKTQPEQAGAQGQEAESQQQVITRLYIELDGVLARMRRGSVDMEEKEQQRPGDVYREVKVGVVFQASRGRERSDLAPDVWVDEPAEGTLRYVAQRTALGNFARLLYTLAVQQGLQRAKQVVVLGDGALWIWRLVEEHFPGAVQIVDLWHAQEHVWEVAQVVYGRSTPEGIAWAKQGCSWLVHGEIEALVTSIEALPPVAPPPGQTHSVPEQAVGYFTTNAERMRYPHFRAQGMHVGSGMAEAACKTVVSTRAKRAGMRWTPEGLDALLPLRTAVLNRTYDAFWQNRSAALVSFRNN
jgi:hypothetical protein